jgi:hypothetical protein
MASKLRTASWVLLVIVAALTIFGSLASATVALRGQEDSLGRATVTELAQGRAGVATAVHGRRLTAAAFGAGFGVLLLAVVLVPYRRGEVWAWWAVLAATLTVALLILARVPFVGTRSGAGTGLVMLVVVGLALALDAGRLRKAPAA